MNCEASIWIARMLESRGHTDPAEQLFARAQFERCLASLDARDQARLRRELAKAEAAN